MKRFVIFNDRYESIFEVDLPAAGRPLSFPIFETQAIGFAVESPESGEKFEVTVGDHALAGDLCHRLRQQIEWSVSPCLDGANGVTPIALRVASNGSVVVRANALVEPSKLSQLAYEHMFEAITRVSIELLLDLVTKSRLSVGNVGRRSASPAGNAISARLELSRIRKFWREFSKLLSRVFDSPSTIVVSQVAVRRIRPTDLAEPQVLRRVAVSGRPARISVKQGLQFALPTKVATKKTQENQLIVGFVRLLQQRLLRSRAVAEREQLSIRSSIDSLSHSDANLHKFVLKRESPRLSKLADTIDVTDGLLAEMSSALQHFGVAAVSAPARSLLGELDTAVFRNHPVYARIALSIRTFLTQTAMVVERGEDEAAKGIETIYEQWVFFELCAAIRSIGLNCVSHRSLFEPISRNRFSVDLDRNAAVIFEAPDGRRISVRYEPVVLPRQAATGVDTIFRGNAQTPWTPDIVIEVSEAQTGPLDYQLVFAAVIDAKYTRRHNLERKMDDVSRYQEIRSVATGKQIVRQIWVAAPVETIISPRDESITWSLDGEIGADPDDTVVGYVGIDPATPEETANTVRTLVQGILNHARDFAARGDH